MTVVLFIIIMIFIHKLKIIDIFNQMFQKPFQVGSLSNISLSLSYTHSLFNLLSI